jgi:hypothetical protein
MKKKKPHKKIPFPVLSASGGPDTKANAWNAGVRRSLAVTNSNSLVLPWGN